MKKNLNLTKNSVFFLILALNLFINSLCLYASEIKATDLEAIKAKEGEFVTVTGTVVGTFKSKSGKAIFFNFGPDHKTCFTAVIFSGNIEKFKGKNGEDPVDYYLNKNVKLDGRIKVHENRPEIILDDPKQLTIVGEAKAEAEIKAEDIEKIKTYDGKLITVAGTIKRVSKAKSGKVTFINFGDDWKSSFTSIVFAGDEEKFKEMGGLESLLNKNVKLTGVVTIYKDKPEIILKSPTQITVQK